MLDLPGVKNRLFEHSQEFSQGVGKIRKGQGTIIVALDGSGDTDNIQEAINMLPSIGGEVYIKEGTYILLKPITLNKPNVKLIGTGRATKITGTTTLLSIENNTTYYHIENIYFYGDGAGLNDCIIIGTGCTGGRVTNCWCENAGRYGIVCGSNSNILTGNFCVGNGNHGIYYYGAGCLVNANANTGNTGAGVQVYLCSGGIVSNNICKENEKDGIRILEGDNNVIIGNYCRDNDYSNTTNFDGIAIIDADYNVITGNRLIDNDGYEINIGAGASGNVVVANVLFGTDHQGGLIDSGTGTSAAYNIGA